jgi:hypothetical protein
LSETRLQETIFVEVWFDGANLKGAKMQGTTLNEVRLQGADLSRAELQGTNLSAADLRGSNLSAAQLQGAIFSPWLDGANLSAAKLQGADLSRARLQGADFSQAGFRGTTLQGAVLYTSLMPTGFSKLDARGLKWQPLGAEEIRSLRDGQKGLIWSSKDEEARYSAAIEKAALPGLRPPPIRSCLGDNETQLPCSDDVSLEKFSAVRQEELEKLVCGSADVARWIFFRPPIDAGVGVAFERQAQDGRRKVVSRPRKAHRERQSASNPDRALAAPNDRSLSSLHRHLSPAPPPSKIRR